MAERRQTTILILGATGTIANLAAHELLSAGPDLRLRLTSHRTAGVAELERAFPDQEVLQVNYEDIDSLVRALSGSDKALVIYPDFIDEKQCCDALATAVSAAGGLEHLVRLLTYPPGLDFDDLSPAEREIPIGFVQGLLARRALTARGLPITLVNILSVFMSNLLWSAETIREENELVLPVLQDLTWIHPANVAALCARILMQGPVGQLDKTYDVIGVETLSQIDVARLLARNLGRPIRYSDDSKLVHKVFGDDAGLFLKYFEFERARYADVSGYQPIDALLDGPPRTMQDWISENITRFQ